MILAVVGDGFIARAVVAAARHRGHDVRVVRDLVVQGAYDPSAPVEHSVERWLGGHASTRTLVARQLEGSHAVVNAAGRAQPASGDAGALYDANAVLPGVLAQIAVGAGVSRLVHVSTAAVQGRRDPLDETAAVAPFSLYSRSKAAGERVLLGHPGGPTQAIVYRPTSVQGRGRPITQRLLRLTTRGRLVMLGHGNTPIPVCLIENVAAGIVHVAGLPQCPPIVLQPWEGMTARLLFEAVGLEPLFVPVPPRIVRAASGLALASNAPWLVAHARRAEMLIVGQRQVASALEDSGFRAPVGHEGYRRLRTVPDEASEPIR